MKRFDRLYKTIMEDTKSSKIKSKKVIKEDYDDYEYSEKIQELLEASHANWERYYFIYDDTMIEGTFEYLVRTIQDKFNEMVDDSVPEPPEDDDDAFAWFLKYVPASSQTEIVGKAFKDWDYNCGYDYMKEKLGPEMLEGQWDMVFNGVHPIDERLEQLILDQQNGSPSILDVWGYMNDFDWLEKNGYKVDEETIDYCYKLGNILDKFYDVEYSDEDYERIKDFVRNNGWQAIWNAWRKNGEVDQ